MNVVVKKPKTKVLFVYPNLQMMQIVPPAVTSLSAFLKEFGIEVSLFDTTFYKMLEKSSDEKRIDTCQVRPFNFSDSDVTYKGIDPKPDFLKKIETFKPDIIAISATDFTHNIAERLIDGLKRTHPEIFIIMGGVYCTFFPTYAIQIPEVDAICIGEGYEALLEVCRAVECGEREKIKNIKNLWVKNHTVIGGVTMNPIRAPININYIPPDDYALFEEKRYWRPMQGKMVKVLPVWIDLGCPYSCKYCVAPSIRNLYEEQFYKYFRTKSVEQIMTELRYLQKKFEPNYLYFSTETFFARSESHIEEFAIRYKEEINIPFWAETRIETVTDKRAQLLREMNCDRLSVGLESGNEQYRQNMLGKKFTNQQFKDGVKILQDNGIRLTINNIVGMPDETREQMFDTIRLNREAISPKTDVSLTVTTFVPCGGSGLQKYCIDKGYFDIDEYVKMKIGSFHFGTYLKMPHIEPKAVEGILRTFPMYVKMPENYFEQIKIAEQFTPEGNAMFSKLRDIYWKQYFK
jgi:radical SAM superfamily enzyme YgiQ (UPF0313 family)